MKSISTVLLKSGLVAIALVSFSALVLFPKEIPFVNVPAFKFGFTAPADSSTVSQRGPFVGPPKSNPLPFAKVLGLIAASAAKHNVPAAFVRSIIAAESGFNSEAISPKGAIGLMQLMPETAREYGADPLQPDQNVDAGTHYLRVLLDRYKSRKNQLQRVIAAYNAGPGMVDKYRGIPPFRETRGYVVRVLAFLHRFSERG